MTVITLGPEGTFSHELALTVEMRARSVLEPTIHSIFAAVAAGRGDGIVPIENSDAGGVGETLDGLMVYPLSIIGEMYMPIHHHLASLVPLDKIRVIYAHPQTHEQCTRVHRTLEGPGDPYEQQCIKCHRSKKDPEAPGRSLSSSAAVIYRMPIVAEHVENNPENTTRFVRISTDPGPDARPGKCSILIDPDTDRAGLLYDLLGVFAQRGINLTRIESRPSKAGHGKIRVLP